MQIKDKIAVVTGGASGLGAQTVQHLAQLGAQVAILDCHTEAPPTGTGHSSVLSIACDVTNESSVQAALETVWKQYSALHIVVNGAGIAPAARILGRHGPMQMDEFQRVLQVNLVGTVHVLKAAAGYMAQQKPLNEEQEERGVIINTASIAAYEGQVGQVAYSASKGGIVALTLPAARELAMHGIRVMTIAPGVMETPMMATLREKHLQSLTQSVPFPPRLGLPSEYAQLVQSIIENPYLNGSVIRLDAALRLA